jgi:hypothetical protein
MASSMLGQPTTHDPQQQQQHVENCLEQCKPWEWLEDYASEPPQDNDAPISLSLFNAKKAKRTDSTYVRWFKFGFEGTSSTKQHISNLGEQGPQKYTEATDENGFIFIIDQDDEEMGGQPPSSIPKKRRADMEEGELP